MMKLLLGILCIAVAVLAPLAIMPLSTNEPAPFYVWVFASLGQALVFVWGINTIQEWRAKRRQARALADLAQIDAELM